MVMLHKTSPARHKGYEGFSSIDDSVETRTEYLHIDASEEAEANTGEFEVRKNLSLVNRVDVPNRFDLDNQMAAPTTS
jgi:hypothetical protein